MRELWQRIAGTTITFAWFVSIVAGIVLIYRQLFVAAEVDDNALLAGVCVLIAAIPGYIGMRALRARWELDVDPHDPIRAIRERAFGGDDGRVRPWAPPATPFWPVAFVRIGGWFAVSVLVFFLLLAVLDRHSVAQHWSVYAALLVLWAVMYRFALRRAYGRR